MLRNALPSLGDTFIGMFKDPVRCGGHRHSELNIEARKINVDTFRVSDMARRERALRRYRFAIASLLRDPNAASEVLIRAGTRMELFLDQVWTARWPLWDGFLLTIEIAAAAIAVERCSVASWVFSSSSHDQLIRLPFRIYVDVMPDAIARADPGGFLHPVSRRPEPQRDAGWNCGACAFCRRAYRRVVARGIAIDPAWSIRGGAQHRPDLPQMLAYVLLPQALRSALPPWINTGVELIKGSSLLSMIGVGELLLKTQEVIGRTFMTIEFYVFAASSIW